MGAQNGAPVPHPAILLPGRTLPPFLATPDPISAVYSELRAGLAAGLEQSFPERPPHPLQPLWALGVSDPWCGPAWPSPAQAEATANTPRSWAVSGLIKQLRPARLRLAEPPRAPVLPVSKRRQPPPHLWPRSPAPDRALAAAKIQLTPAQGHEGLKKPRRN